MNVFKVINKTDNCKSSKLLFSDSSNHFSDYFSHHFLIVLIIFFLISSEKSKIKTREDAWNKIESLAVKNPKFDDLKKENSGLESFYNLSLSNDVFSPIDDYEEMSYEKFEHEAKEVSIVVRDREREFLIFIFE